MDTSKETSGRGPERRPDRSVQRPSQQPVRRPLQRLDAATGFSLGLDLARSLRHRLGAVGGHIDRAEQRLANNLLAEDRLVQGDFASLLALWQVPREALPLYIRQRRREAFGWLVLTLLSLLAVGANLLWPAPLPLVRLFSLFAAASFLVASALACLAAAWRVHVCRQQRFVPFAVWLGQLVGPGRSGAPAAGPAGPESGSTSGTLAAAASACAAQEETHGSHASCPGRTAGQ